MEPKRKFIRFLPFFGGLISLVIGFIAHIPIGSLFSMRFHIVELHGIFYYIWGVVEGGNVWFEFVQLSLDNIVPLLLWILLLFSGICGIIGASYKEKPATIKKLLLIGGFTVVLELLYFTVLIFINLGSVALGLGYYGLIIISILYFLSAGLITDYQK